MAFDVAAFKGVFPEFAGVDGLKVTAASERAELYLSANCNKSRLLAWQLLTAHILTLSKKATDGDTAGVLASASEGSVSVSFATQDVSGDRYWYSQTPYGQEYLVLLKRCNIGGRYISGQQPFNR